MSREQGPSRGKPVHPDCEKRAQSFTKERRAAKPKQPSLKAAARANGQAVKARETAGMYRTMTNEVKAEQNLRRRLADKHPTLHRSEQQARQELQHRAARVVHQAPAAVQVQQQQSRGQKM
ncbi:hypothetical protein ACWEAF_30955 [Streptomyces sp. NPDC005071]